MPSTLSAYRCKHKRGFCAFILLTLSLAINLHAPLFRNIAAIQCYLLTDCKTGYWGMFLIGVSLGYYLFVDTSSKGKSRNAQVVKVWMVAASFW
jgi:hypothetical protein